MSNKIGLILAGSFAYDVGAEPPYGVMHDGVGSNIVNLLFGWAAGFLFWGIATLIWKNRTEQVGAANRDNTGCCSQDL
ncbi:hypothetical protein [Sulfuriroseicoccus oceanibius]|uniref:Uncharacterized protein n=1 Tax=Sulfuriroseicoccus oceanibius TaxID=2707525 RepID=A0A6B3LFX4_9BACT|nr:hypothetical protein [Sulfuriroseicoccus oceanibius]QQL44054.1 hypothetical protein G3M56_009125 [Sulfuriroseicoccus oceanibius]QQL44599.1 hypothetical protein G3M56_012010 [Sulfuriroseicoccus oceanibius]